MTMIRQDERAWALPAALVALALVTTIAVEWHRIARSEVDASSRLLERVQIRWALDAVRPGVVLALASDPTPGADGPDDPWLQTPEDPVFLGGVALRLSLHAEDDRWDMNNLGFQPDDPAVRPPARCWRDLKTLLGWNRSDGMASAVIDWIDPDGKGASENGWYLDLPEPRLCKNRPLDLLSELLRVRSFAPILLRGGVDPATGREILPLDRVATVLPRLRTGTAAPVNVNLASEDLLRGLVGLDRLRAADRILRRREAAPFLAEEDLRQTLGPAIWDSLSPWISVGSEWIRVEAVADLHGARRRLTALVHRPGGGAPVFRRWWVHG